MVSMDSCARRRHFHFHFSGVRENGKGSELQKKAAREKERQRKESVEEDRQISSLLARFNLCSPQASQNHPPKSSSTSVFHSHPLNLSPFLFSTLYTISAAELRRANLRLKIRVIGSFAGTSATERLIRTILLAE